MIDAWGNYTEDTSPKYDPNNGGGEYTGGVGVHIDPKTGKVDPSYHPPASTGGTGGSGGGIPGLGGSGAPPATAAPATGGVASPADWAGWTSTGGTTTGVGGAVTPAASTPWYSSVGKFFAGTGAGGAGSTAASVLPWIQFAASYLESQKSGTFKQIPMSPEQKTMFDWAMHYIQTTPDNRAAIDSMLKFDLGHPSTIDVAALKDGKVGYTPQGHMPGVDLATMIRNQNGAPPTAAPPPSAPGGYVDGQQGLADLIRNVQSP